MDKNHEEQIRQSVVVGHQAPVRVAQKEVESVDLEQRATLSTLADNLTEDCLNEALDSLGEPSDSLAEGNTRCLQLSAGGE